MAFSYKQRLDGGFDFYDPLGKKTTIENYTKSTGTNMNQLRASLSGKGDKQSQQIVSKLPPQFSAATLPKSVPSPILSTPTTPKVPVSKSVADYNKLDVFGQRQKLADLRGLAGRTQFNSQEDINNAKWAQNEINNLEKNGVKKGGNPLTFAQDFAAGAQQSLSKVGDVALQGGAVLGSIGKNDQQIQKIVADTEAARNNLRGFRDVNNNSLAGTSGVDEAAARLARGDINLKDIAAVGGEGLDVANTATMFVNPTSSLVRNAAVKDTAGVFANGVLPRVAKESALFGGTTGLQSGAQTYGQTGDLGQALEATATGALTGAVTQGALGLGAPILGRGIRQAVDNNPVHQSLLKSDPVYATNTSKLSGLDAAMQRAAVNGDVRALEGLQRVKQNLSDQNAMITKRHLEQGPVGIPDKATFSSEETPSALDRMTVQGAPQANLAQQIQTPQKSPSSKVMGDPVPDSSNQYSRSDQLPDSLGNRPYTNSAIPADVSQYVNSQVKQQRVQSSTPIKQKFQNFVDTTKNLLVDDAVAYERYVKDKGTRAALREGVDRVRSSDMIARQFAEDNGMKEIGKMGKNDLNTFQQYLIAKRAQELSAKGIKTGRDAKADAQLIQSVGDKYAPQEQIIREYSKKMLHYSVEKGLISKELRDSLLRDNPSYVPMNRVMDALEEQGLQKSKQLGNISKQSVVKRIKGSERIVDNPIESFITNTLRMVNEGERNSVAKALANTDAFAEKVLKEGEKPKPGFDTLHYVDNGNKVTVEVPALVAKEMKNLNNVLPDWANKTIGVLGAPTKVLRTGATSANPIFALSNVVRDQVQTLITGGVRSNLRGTPKAFIAAFDPGPAGKSLRAEMQRNGIIGNEYRQTYGFRSGDLMKELQNTSRLDRRSLQRLKSPIDSLADLIGRTEYFTRAQQYFGTNGDVVAKSQAARNNTLNFSRSGTVTRTLNKLIPFLNAGVQGGRMTVNQFKNRPVHTSVAFATLTGVALAARAMNESQNKELYDRLTDEEKKNNLIIFSEGAQYDPESNRITGMIKIPMPQMLYPILDGVNNVKGKPEDIARIGADMIAATTGIDATNPINQLTPTIAKPFVEAAVNKSTYTGREIVSEYDKNKNPEDKGAKYSSGTARGVAKAIGIDAPIIDNFIQSWGGGLFNDLSRNLTDNPDNTKDGKGLGGMFTNGFARRFMSGGVTSQYEIQKNLGDGYKKSVKESAEFKALSSDEQLKVLNKIDADTIAIAGTASKTEQGKTDEIKKDLSKRQKSLLENGFNPDQYVKMTQTNLSLPENIPTTAKTVLEKYDSLDTTERDAWNTQKNADTEVTKGLQSWIGDKAKIPEVTNEVAKQWADYQKDVAEGKVSKLNMEDKKKSILKAAFNSQLSVDEREIASLSKAELAYYRDNGVINDENIAKAIEVEKQLFAAGLISKETLQRNLGLAAGGYKTSGGKGGKGGGKGRKGGITSIADILAGDKSINKTKDDTYLALSKLLGGVSKTNSKNKIGKKVTLQKINVKGVKS